MHATRYIWAVRLRLQALKNRLHDLQSRILDPANDQVMLRVLRDEITLVLGQIDALAAEAEEAGGHEASGPRVRFRPGRRQR